MGSEGKSCIFREREKSFSFAKKKVFLQVRGHQGEWFCVVEGRDVEFQDSLHPKSLESSHLVVEISFFSILIFTYEYPDNSVDLH